MDEIEKERMADSLQYQIDELEKAQLKVGEEEELTAKRDLLRNSEKLTEALNGAYNALYAADQNAQSLTDEASALIGRAAVIADDLRETADIIENASSLLFDASERIRDFRDSLEFSPEEYDNIESRLSLIKKLRRKYNMDEEAMLAHLDDCRRKLSELEYAGDMLIKLNKQLEKYVDNCKKSPQSLVKSAVPLPKVSKNAS